MGTCSNCGSTSGNNQTCATKTSQLVWDGGSLCNGYSGTSVNDAILSLAQSICNLNTEIGAFTPTSDDILYTTTSTVLTTVLDDILSDISTLQSDLGALDGTKVIHYDNTTSTIASGTNVYATLKTFSIPADTWEENFDYLLVEFELNSQPTDKGDLAKYRVMCGGVKVLEYTLADGVTLPSINGVRGFVTLVKYNSNTVSGDYHAINKYGFSYIGRPDYGFTVNASPLTFTGAITLTIDAYNETGAVDCSLLRITKFKKSIGV